MFPSERTDCVAIPHPAHVRELEGATYVLMVAVDLLDILTVAAGVSREERESDVDETRELL
jgi:hypothetical protein